MYLRFRRCRWFDSSGTRQRTKSNNKHGVDFETAQLVFDDPFSITFLDRIVDEEERWHAIGTVEDVIIIILVVVHTYRSEGSGEVIRIISARLATRGERRLYVKAIG